MGAADFELTMTAKKTCISLLDSHTAHGTQRHTYAVLCNACLLTTPGATITTPTRQQQRDRKEDKETARPFLTMVTHINSDAVRPPNP